MTIEETILLIERSIAVANSNTEFDDIVFDADGFKLSELYDDNDLDNFATRQEVAAMLYYVLSGNHEYVDDKQVNEADDKVIEYDIDEDEVQLFDDTDFSKVFDEISDLDEEDLEYVKFKLPIQNGNLYYKYDESDSTDTKVEGDIRYYVHPVGDQKDISKVSFVPKLNYSGIVYIQYKGFDSGDDSYLGLIKITIAEDKKIDFDTIKYNAIEDNPEMFKVSSFSDAITIADDKIDYITFDLPDAKLGKLYYNIDSDSIFEMSEEIVEGDEFQLAQIGKIIFVPYNHFVGKPVFKYTVIDENEESYDGDIEITVKEDYLIETIELETSGSTIEFDIKEELDDEYDFEKIKFTKLPDADDGILYIDFDTDKVNLGTVYDIDDLDKLTFK